ncbi:MAG: hypothetical protein V4584_04735 [Verrucomicrobiota bacterium]
MIVLRKSRKTTMNPMPQYEPTRRTRVVRGACAAIGAIVFAFGFHELFHFGTGSDSMITLPVSFTFAMEAYSYTGNSKGISRRTNAGFLWPGFVMLFLGLGLMFLAPMDAVWSYGTRVGVISCFACAHLLLFLAYFRQPYQQAGRSGEAS